MRIYVSKYLGHGVRVGASEDAGRLLGARKPTKAARSVAPLRAAAIAEAEARNAELERAVAQLGANTTDCAMRIADLDVQLATCRTGRDDVAAHLRGVLSPEGRQQLTGTLAQWDAYLATLEAQRADMDRLMRESAASHAHGLRSLADRRAELAARR